MENNEKYAIEIFRYHKLTATNAESGNLCSPYHLKHKSLLQLNMRKTKSETLSLLGLFTLLKSLICALQSSAYQKTTTNLHIYIEKLSLRLNRWIVFNCLTFLWLKLVSQSLS
ncbi:CLUMA_CG021592, isoform A [Clunio marinus]|uniref:CLUMA_CG021592, isoform A n=1 Tax=Clunio marinus TaxID=568069 RepID=A0A1J1J7Q8_9DIPT|nr:CLUMA_CG021592, isoform A [Clunio marinus]